MGKSNQPNQGVPVHGKNTIHTRSGQDIPRRNTRRPQALRQPNPRPALNSRQESDRPPRGEGRDRPLPTLRLRENLQAAPGRNRARRTAPADARMGLSPRPARRRLRRLRIAHERMARRSGSGAKRAPNSGTLAAPYAKVGRERAGSCAFAIFSEKRQNERREPPAIRAPTPPNMALRKFPAYTCKPIAMWCTIKTGGVSVRPNPRHRTGGGAARIALTAPGGRPTRAC